MTKTLLIPTLNEIIGMKEIILKLKKNFVGNRTELI